MHFKEIVVGLERDKYVEKGSRKGRTRLTFCGMNIDKREALGHITLDGTESVIEEQ